MTEKGSAGPDWPRIADPDPATATEAQRQVLADLIARRGRVPTPYRIWLHAPALAQGMEALGTPLHAPSALTPAAQELVVFLTVVHWNAPYPIGHHIGHARAAGFPERAVQAILNREPPVFDDPHLAAVAGLTRVALAGGHIDDAGFDGYVATLGRTAIAEIVALVGYYTSVAIALTLHGSGGAAP